MSHGDGGGLVLDGVELRAGWEARLTLWVQPSDKKPHGPPVWLGPLQTDLPLWSTTRHELPEQRLNCSLSFSTSS
ncbi:unnamed protein product [Arctogadus glacialis]